VTAFNINGWGKTSESTTSGAQVLTAPRFMNSVVRDPRTNDRQLFIHWSEITSDENIGGAPVLSYGLQWDNGSSNQQWS